MTTYRPCTNCGNSMRKHNQLAADHPGTVRPGAKGVCKVCRDKEIQSQPVPPVVEPRQFDLAQTITALNGWTTERNRRLGVMA